MQTDEGENDKICKDKEKVEMNGVENVKVEIKDFKNQVMEKLEALIKKTPDPYSCIGCSLGSFCLDGKPVGCHPLEKTMVTANSNIRYTDSGDIVYAGDTGIGYYQDNTTYTVIWEKAGVQVHVY